MLKTLIKPADPRWEKSIPLDSDWILSSVKFINLLGYAILCLMVIDYFVLLAPPKFLNPNWELETMGKIIETAFVPLLGFMLVFFRLPEQSIKYRELRILSWMSWLALIVGIIFFLFTPLTLSNAIRIDNRNQIQVSSTIAGQRKQLEQINLQLDRLEDSQIQQLWQRNQSKTQLEVASPQEQRQFLLNLVSEKEQQESSNLKKNLSGKRRNLFKMTFKWLLGSIIAGLCFISLWKYTDWVRAIWLQTQRRL